MFTVDDALRAYTLAFAVKTEIQYFFIRVLIAWLLRWDSIEKLSIRDFWISYFTSSNSIKIASFYSTINTNWASFIIVIFASTWIICLLVARRWLSILSTIGCRLSFHHSFQHTHTLGIERCFFVTLLAHDDLCYKINGTLALGFLFFFISKPNRSEAQFRHKSCPQASIKISSGIVPHFLHDCGYCEFISVSDLYLNFYGSYILI